MTGIINAQNQVERVQTWIDQPIVGDMLVETVYSGYKDFGGVRFPSRIVQSQDGFPSLDLTVSTVTANPAVDIAVPDNVRTAQPPPPVDRHGQKLADGVFYLTGGSHHSLAVEMKDHIVLVDTPQTEARALAVIAKAKEVIPNKPIRFVVTSHHHWDHLGGIRAAMDEGATIVTHQIEQGVPRARREDAAHDQSRPALDVEEVGEDSDRRRHGEADRRHADDRAAPADRTTSTRATCWSCTCRRKRSWPSRTRSRRRRRRRRRWW